MQVQIRLREPFQIKIAWLTFIQGSEVNEDVKGLWLDQEIDNKKYKN